MKKSLKDIPITEVLEQQHKWQQNNMKSSGPISTQNSDYVYFMPFTYEVLGKKYGSEKLVYKKMEQLADRGYLDYGVSLRTAWLTEKGLEALSQMTKTQTKK